MPTMHAKCMRIDLMWVHKENTYFAKLNISDTLSYKIPHPKSLIFVLKFNNMAAVTTHNSCEEGEKCEKPKRKLYVY